MAMLEDLRVLDSDGEQSLLTENNLPDDNAGSDHLPLIESFIARSNEQNAISNGVDSPA